MPRRAPALVVGDTWAVDVALARAQGWDSLLTLTGTTAADAAAPWATADEAPTSVAARLSDVIVRA